MRERRLVVIVTILGLYAASCTPAISPTPTPTGAPPPPKPPGVETPAPKSAVPATTPKAAAEQPRYGGILTRSTFDDAPHFDLQQQTSESGSLQLFNVFQGLVRLHHAEHEKIVPELAEKWEASADGASYTFQFFDGIKWHDGQPFSAEDAKYSLDRMRNPKEFKTVSPRGQGLLVAVDNVEVLDRQRIRVALKFSSASFLVNIASGWAAIEPKHILVAKGDLRRDLVGTGPFKLKEFNANISLELAKYPDYHIKGVPYLDGIKIYTIKDDATRFAAFRTGRVKMTAGASRGLFAEQAEIVKKDMSGVAVVHERSAISRYAVTMNLQREPWGNVKVRKAVDLALDRQAAIKVNGKGVVGGALDPLGSWGMKESEVTKLPGYRQPKDADIAAGKALLAEAGFPTGFKTRLLFRNGGATEQQGMIAKGQLAKIGIDAEPQVADEATVSDRFNRRDFDIASYSFADNTGDPDETLNLYYVTGGSRNYGNFSDKEIDQLVAKQALTLDDKARRVMVADIERRLMDSVPMAISFWNTFQTGAWVEVRNYTTGPGVHPWNKLDYVWLDK